MISICSSNEGNDEECDERDSDKEDVLDDGLEMDKV